MAEKGAQVVVQFPVEISVEQQGPALLAFEIILRTMTGKDVRVVKNLMGDDSKLRRLMTIQQRENL
jgi:hypothetical protein